MKKKKEKKEVRIFRNSGRVNSLGRSTGELEGTKGKDREKGKVKTFDSKKE